MNNVQVQTWCRLKQPRPPTQTGEAWGGQQASTVAHTFDLAHPHTQACSQHPKPPSPHMPLFLPFFSSPKMFPQPPTVTTKPHTETHPYKYLWAPPRGHTPDHPPPVDAPLCLAIRAYCAPITPLMSSSAPPTPHPGAFRYVLGASATHRGQLRHVRGRLFVVSGARRLVVSCWGGRVVGVRC